MPIVDSNINPCMETLCALMVRNRWRGEDDDTVTASRSERRAKILQHLCGILVICGRHGPVPDLRNESAIERAAEEAWLHDPVFHALANALEHYISRLVDAAASPAMEGRFVADEREACARVLDEAADHYVDPVLDAHTLAVVKDLAARIRARGKG